MVIKLAQIATVNHLKKSTQKTTDLIVDVFQTMANKIASDSAVDNELNPIFSKAESDIAVIKASLGITQNWGGLNGWYGYC